MMVDSKTQLAVDIEWVASALAPISRLHSPVWVFDIDNSRIIWANQASSSVWQSESVEELLNREMGSEMSPSVAQRLNQYQVDFTNNSKTQFKEFWTLYPNGQPATYDVVFTAFQLNTGRMCMFCEVVEQQTIDIDTLRSSEALMHTSVNISLYDTEGLSLYRNPAARSTVSSADNTLCQHFVSKDIVDQLLKSDNDEVNAVTSVNTVDGEKWHDITARRCLDAVSGDPAWLISEVDVTRLKATEERAQFLAEHDTLTQLPNRNYVSVHFQARIDKLLADNKKGALVFLDLDNFKDVNDTLGHTAGDQLLVEISKRLLSVVNGDDSVARLGGDEFILLVELSDNECEIGEFANEIINVVTKTAFIENRELQVTPSVGVAMLPGDGINILELMRHADLAMYAAKDNGKNNVAYFTNELSDAVEIRITMEAEIKRGLDNDEFVAFFQPRVDVASGEIVGAEALARWQHPEKGLVPPDLFIPTCESSGLIGNLGETIFIQSVNAQRIWAEQGHDIKVSVNLSPLQFGESDLVQQLIRNVELHGGNAKKIELEITESVLLGNDEETIDKLHQLVQYGFEIAIDDFGTGYSNLAYLHRYPISCLKIDRSFIDSIDTVKPIIELIISMAELFDLYVVAEGVECIEQLEILQAFKCKEYQGYYFEKPIAFDLFLDLLGSIYRKSA